VIFFANKFHHKPLPVNEGKSDGRGEEGEDLRKKKEGLSPLE